MNKPHCITCGGNHDGDFCPPAADQIFTGQGIHPSVYRLKCLIRDKLPGQCKMLSHGDDCTCGLCDADRLQETLEICLGIINDGIRRGMPITKQVAKVSNQIRGIAQ